jgi:hypothetical protein
MVHIGGSMVNVLGAEAYKDIYVPFLLPFFTLGLPGELIQIMQDKTFLISFLL